MKNFMSNPDSVVGFLEGYPRTRFPSYVAGGRVICPSQTQFTESCEKAIREAYVTRLAKSHLPVMTKTNGRSRMTIKSVMTNTNGLLLILWFKVYWSWLFWGKKNLQYIDNAPNWDNKYIQCLSAIHS